MTIINLIARKSCSIYWRVSDTPVNLIRSAIVRGCESTLASILGLPVKAAGILVSKHVTSPRTGTRTRIPDLQDRRWSAHVTRAYRYRMQQNTQHTMHTRVHTRCISADTRIHSNREASIYGAVLALIIGFTDVQSLRATGYRYPIRQRYSSKSAIFLSMSILSAALNTKRQTLFASDCDQFFIHII